MDVIASMAAKIRTGTGGPLTMAERIPAYTLWSAGATLATRGARLYWHDSRAVQAGIDALQILYIFAITVMTLLAMYELVSWMCAPAVWTAKAVRWVFRRGRGGAHAASVEDGKK